MSARSHLQASIEPVLNSRLPTAFGVVSGPGPVRMSRDEAGSRSPSFPPVPSVLHVNLSDELTTTQCKAVITTFGAMSAPEQALLGEWTSTTPSCAGGDGTPPVTAPSSRPTGGSSDTSPHPSNATPRPSRGNVAAYRLIGGRRGNGSCRLNTT